MSRLPARIEVSSLIRRAEIAGGSGTVLASGDRDSGALVLLIASRGVHAACLERQLSPTGYAWQITGPPAGADSQAVAEWAQKRRKFDADCWLLDLDIPSTERFIAETISIG